MLANRSSNADDLKSRCATLALSNTGLNKQSFGIPFGVPKDGVASICWPSFLCDPVGIQYAIPIEVGLRARQVAPHQRRRFIFHGTNRAREISYEHDAINEASACFISIG
jgi:hypothetical protein